MTGELQAEWVPAQTEFDAFAKVSGDDNPIHVDPEFSARTQFGRTVSHGMLIYSKLWGLLKSHRPGAEEREQSMMFPNPCYTGETVILTVQELGEKQVAFRAVRKSDNAELLVGKAKLK